MRPLSGIRVVDFTDIWAGPWSARLLRELGAHVIKVEGPRQQPRASDPNILRVQIATEERDDRGRPRYFRNAYQTMTNPGKDHVALNLKDDEGAELFRSLVAVSDVVIENWAPHVMPSLGLGYEDLRKVRPDVIMLRTSAMGQSGPEHRYTGLGATAEVLSGLSTISGYDGGEPQKSGINYGDPFAGIHGAYAIMAALLRRSRTGRGALIDLSLSESLITTLGEYTAGVSMNGEQPPRMGNRHPGKAPHNVYPCAGEDDWVFLEAGSESEFQALCTTIGRPELIEDPRFKDVALRKANEDALDAEISAWTSGRSHMEAMDTLQRAGVPAGAVLDGDEVVRNPHHEANRAFAWVDHPDGKSYPIPQMPWRVPSAPTEEAVAVPAFGADNFRLFTELCGEQPDRVERMLESEAILS